MSQTRILCENCGAPQCYCNCEPKPLSGDKPPSAPLQPVVQTPRSDAWLAERQSHLTHGEYDDFDIGKHCEMKQWIGLCRTLELELDAANRELQARGKDIEPLTNALNYALADLGLNPVVRGAKESRTLDGVVRPEIGG